MLENTKENIKAYCENDPFVFISYPHDDSVLVLSIISTMQDRAYRVWYDEGIAPAAEYEADIFRRMQESACVIFFISSHFFSSAWCKKEMDRCIKYKKDFLLIFLEGQEPPKSYLEDLGFAQNGENAELIDSKQHVFWSGYRSKFRFYEKLEEWEMLSKCREAVDKRPISKIFDNFGGIKQKTDTSLQFSDCITFGRYPTGVNAEMADIIWRVIAVEENRVLLFSEYLLDARHFHEKEEEVCWESCDLQKWLNSEFYDQAFNEEEKKDILISKVSTRSNQVYGTECGPEVESPVFLLSAEEVYLYFTENPGSFYYQTDKFQTVGQASFLLARYTEYAGTRTCYTNNERAPLSGWWWLRTSGEKKTMSALISSTPQLNMGGVSVKFPPNGPKPAGGVRPAIWIRR